MNAPTLPPGSPKGTDPARQTPQQPQPDGAAPPAAPPAEVKPEAAADAKPDPKAETPDPAKPAHATPPVKPAPSQKGDKKTGKPPEEQAAKPEPAKPAPVPAKTEPAKPAPAPVPVPAPAPASPPAPIQASTPTPPPVAPTAPASQLRRRHVLVLLSFVIMVVIPALVTAWYMWTRAADQYASYAGFSVRTEDQKSAVDSLLGPLNLGGGSGAPDAEVLFQFIQGQDLAATIDARIDLRAIWSRVNPSIDPVFAYHPPGTIEDLHDHWRRMVSVSYDAGTGLLDLRVLAFDPDEAQLVAREIVDESSALINQLSAIAREDAISYARDELNTAVERLKQARSAVTEFRNRTQIVDPTIDLQSQIGLLGTLNQQLVEALIERDLLSQTTRTQDPRISQADRRVKVIEARIADERRKLGLGDGTADNEVFATLVGEYERLVVDREFAETTYTAALASYDAARADAGRQTRYLAAHLRPTLAEKSQFPQRWTLLGLVVLFAFLLWSILVLTAYSLRDRR